MMHTMLRSISAMLRHAFMTIRVSPADKPLVGSSMKSTVGSETSSTPMLTRFFCPPDMPRRLTSPTTELWMRSRLSSWMAPSMMALRRAGSVDISTGSRRLALQNRFSSTVS
mmetsp:Transcript_48716/g.93202  ORF Transcript_48716/g.93202 Transcript_48716/m.93202 type:complete len:112 (+) Transcript_48716:2378-2713(+)